MAEVIIDTFDSKNPPPSPDVEDPTDEEMAIAEAFFSITASTQLEFYSDDEERDDHGRWTKGVASTVRDTGGATFEPVYRYQPTTGFIVAKEGIPSTFVPADTFLHDDEAAYAAIDGFLAEHVAEYDDPNAMVGIWHDTANNEVVLDVVEQFDDKEEAVAAGVDRNQQAIWDVVNKAEIDTGGTGKP